MTRRLVMHAVHGCLVWLLLSMSIAPWPAAASRTEDPPLLLLKQTTGVVAINEFVASNQSGLQDEDGDHSDWIELYVPGATPVNVAGWSLTDDPANPSKWVFPARTLPGNSYLVIFASEKDRTPPAGPLHTSFRLNASGEYLGLFDNSTPRQVVDEFSPVFPGQYGDVSYGRYNTPGEYRYFSYPTPGTGNDFASAYLGVVAPVGFSSQRGFYEQTVYLTLTTDTAGASIRYTSSGATPSPSYGSIYNTPINISSTTHYRAIAYKTGYLSSPVSTHSFIFPNHVINQPANPASFPATWGVYNGAPVPADYEMDPDIVRDPRYRDTILNDLRALPTLSLVTSRADMFDAAYGIYANPTLEGDPWERPGSLELIYPDGSTGFQVNAGICIHGGRSRIPTESAKHSFRVYFRAAYGLGELVYPLFADSLIDEFEVLVLRGYYGDSWMRGSTRGLYLRDQWMRDVQNDMGQYGSHGAYVHLYVNGLYWGVYNIAERLDEHFAASYLGGAADEYDVIKGTSWGNYSVAHGAAQAWDSAMSLASQDLSIPANYTALLEIVDVVDLIDYMLTHFYAGTEAEWPGMNWVTMRRRLDGEKFRFFNWDIELTLRDLDINKLDVDAFNSPSYLYYRLRTNPEFRLLFADRVHRHFFNGGAFFVDPNHPQWDPDHPENNAPAARLWRRASEIERAMVGESARWGDWYFGWLARTLDDDWIAERDWLLTEFFPQRSAIVLQQLRNAGLYPSVVAPSFSQHGGSVPAGFQLTMTAPSGVIYFTTDGSDPRIPGSGAVSPTAAAFSAPLALPSGLTTVKARVRDGALWSALNEAVFQAPNDWSSLKLTEIMYNPLGGSDFEFLELKNIGPATLNLAGVQVANGVDFSFSPLATLGPGQFAVLANNPTAFAARYPGVPLAGEFARDLGNGGDTLTLLDPQGAAILTVQYDDAPPWPTTPDGLGYSLVISDPLADPTIPANWRASSAIHGSPLADDPPPTFAGVVINEVLAHSDPPFEDAIELRNLTTAPIDIGGWFLSDDANSPAKFRIPDGTVVAPGGFAVFYEYQFNSTPGVPPSFGLSSTGERLFLLAAEPGGGVIGFADSVQFDPSLTNTAIGRFQASTAPRFTHLSRPTFGVENPASLQHFRTGVGAPNAYPLVGPLVINELMYNPPSGGHEFIELRNMTRAPLPLFDPANLTSVWRFTNGIEFDFPPNSSIPPLGLALVVPIDPATFAATYNVPADVQVFGPFTGALDNGGETLSLSRPDTPNGATVPYIPVDTVTYDDAPPWPTQPDGSGPSLERLSGPSFPDDPVLWQASSPASSPGQPNTACQPADVHPNKIHSLPSLCDYDVDIADVQTVAACWNLPLNAPNCPPSLNTDGLDPFFTVGDIIASAASWGWRR